MYFKENSSSKKPLLRSCTKNLHLFLTLILVFTEKVRRFLVFYFYITEIERACIKLLIICHYCIFRNHLWSKSVRTLKKSVLCIKYFLSRFISFLISYHFFLSNYRVMSRIPKALSPFEILFHFSKHSGVPYFYIFVLKIIFLILRRKKICSFLFPILFSLLSLYT